jgi:hypothetical protein
MTARDDRQRGAHLPTGPLVGTALSLVLLTAACGGDGDDPPQTQPTASQTASSIPTKTLSPQEQREEDAKADAEATIARYFRVTDEVGTDLKTPLSKLRTVSISTDLAIIEKRYRQERSKGVHQTGKTKAAVQSVEEVNLDNSAPKRSVVPFVLLSVCVDVSEVDVLDRQGSSIVAPSRPEATVSRYAVSNYEWRTNRRGGWRVSSVEYVEEVESCDA